MNAASQGLKVDHQHVQHSKFLKHTGVLIWKSYVQRQRRWRYLLFETLFASALFLASVFVAKPIFLTPLQAEPEPPLTGVDIAASINTSSTILGYAPHKWPVNEIMKRVSSMLGIGFIPGKTEDSLNRQLTKIANNSTGKFTKAIMWVLWTEHINKTNKWKITIRSTERARYETDETDSPNPHLRAGFLAVQYSVSQAILEHNVNQRMQNWKKQNFSENYVHWFENVYKTKYPPEERRKRIMNTTWMWTLYSRYYENYSISTPKYHFLPSFNLKLVSMPVSPLMQEYRVRKALSIILLCFTLALLPPVLETEALVVNETVSRFKRSLRIHSVNYSSMYLGWIMYAHLTAIPICFLAAITLITIFRWIHLVFAMMLILAYLSVMVMNALIMAMFHQKAWISCVWTTLFTLTLTYLAELLVHHKYDEKHEAITFLLHVFIAPLGLVHEFNSFALLQTGRGRSTITSSQSLALTIGLWVVLILIYFLVLMLMQRTMRNNAIGGPISWKKIIFKEEEDVNKLRPIENPTGRERDNLQEVDDYVAKAISFRNVSKSIMGESVLKNITFDVYRGEFTMFFCERVQEKMAHTLEDLLIGLTSCDEGLIYVFGQLLTPADNYTNASHMMGYCHWSKLLIDDLTVDEHIEMFLHLCLWQESGQYITEYGHMRKRRLLVDCNLEVVKRERVRNIGLYYRAQLCWALALLLEPKVIIIPSFLDHQSYVDVIRDKIMTYRKHLTIINFCFASIQLEYADRVFVFDTKIVAFGGTPAYMFFKYGREYRIRLSLQARTRDDEREMTSELIARVEAAGATVRAFYGSLLILRLPVTPTEQVAAIILHLTENAKRYKITSLNITVPDSEEVYKRTIYETRTAAAIEAQKDDTPADMFILRKIGEPRPWEQGRGTMLGNILNLRNIGWKVFSFHVHYRLLLILTMITATVAGIFLGLTFSALLENSERDKAAARLIHGEVMTLEALPRETVLVMRRDDSSEAKSIAHAYVLSHTNATASEVTHISYTALPHTEDLKEYLMTRAIDSPQFYVSIYAYGLDLNTDKNKLNVDILYSPLHSDRGAASRSMAKTFTALLRHYSGQLDAYMQFTDDPLALDLTPWMTQANQPPLLVQFLLILSVAHVTFLPSKEHGLIRHTQSHARNFSPVRYWFSLYFCDLVLYWMLLSMMTGTFFLMMYFTAPQRHFLFEDLYVVPFMLILYGVVCIPQAYLFSLGSRVALNATIYIVVNLILGETTVIAKIFYGDTFSYVLYLMILSPQFNMVYAIVKIKKIFLYNSECIIFKEQNICSSTKFNKCCQTCGILQDCFYKKNYLDTKMGIKTELVAMVVCTFIYMGLLLLIEYKVCQRICKAARSLCIKRKPILTAEATINDGYIRERKDVVDKLTEIKCRRKEKVDTFGEYLLADNVTKKEGGFYTCRNVYLGLSRGDVLALSGLKRHGRLKLCAILAGYDIPTHGTVRAMSTWRSDCSPHKFACNISYSSGSNCLPTWMTVTDALEMIALLRGVPREYVHEEVYNHIVVLELIERANTLIGRTTSNERTRLNFAAAVIGAPSIVVIDECTAYQKFSVRRVMYYILHHLRKRGHAILISASDVESHMPIANKLAIMLDGRIYDVDTVDNLVTRYSMQGYTVVLHLKEEVVDEAVLKMFYRYFTMFQINDTTEVLVSVQILDPELEWGTIFQKMEILKSENQQVYSYIITTAPIDYIYNSIISRERGNIETPRCFRCLRTSDEGVVVSVETLNRLQRFERKYDITQLRDLPWSVIFH